jgi:hypothetical protein
MEVGLGATDEFLGLADDADQLVGSAYPHAYF